jgi:antitoxin HicB
MLGMKRSQKMKSERRQLSKVMSEVDTASELLTKPYGRLVIPDDDGSFRAEMLEFPGAIATGETAAEALSNLEEVAEGWLETAIANGQPIPEPMDNVDFSGRLVLRLPKSLHQRAAYAAERDGASLNQFIVGAVAIQVGAAETRQFGTTNYVLISGSQNNQINVYGTLSIPASSGVTLFTLTTDDLKFIPVGAQKELTHG